MKIISEIYDLFRVDTATNARQVILVALTDRILSIADPVCDKARHLASLWVDHATFVRATARISYSKRSHSFGAP